MTAMNPRNPAQRRPGPACPVCLHPELEQIDLALAIGAEARAEVGRRYGLDRSALYRHAHGGHLDNRLVAHAADAASAASESLLARIVTLADRLERRLVLREQADASDADVARIARELRGAFDLLARVSGRLVDRVEITGMVGRWVDADVVSLADRLLAAIENDWPAAADAARAEVAGALSASGREVAR